jgi:hypothetical protein
VGCSTSKLQLNAYLLDDANVGGDPGRSLKPVKNILVWPLENIAAGGKSKGIETPMTGLLIDTLILRSGFERVVILEEDQAKDLLTRAGEELGLKKKPKSPIDGALIATKLGQLSGTECILLGRLEVYDEDKVDKSTATVVAASFNLLDAREKGYTTIDSFTAVRRLWRIGVKRTSFETPFGSRKGMDDTARLMLQDVVDRMSVDLGQGVEVSKKMLAKKVDDLSYAAEKSLDEGQFDKATASWNEVLKLQPDSKRAKKGLEEVEQRKREAEELAKAAALKKQIDEIRGKAIEADKGGDLEGAFAGWNKILELDKKNDEAADEAADLEKRIADKKKKEAEEAERKAAAEKKAKEEAEKKAREEAERKAQEDAARKAEEAAKRAAEPAPAPAAEPAPAATAPSPAPAVPATPAASPAPEPKLEAAPTSPAESKPEVAPAPAPKPEPVVEKKVEEKPAAAAPAAGGGELDGLRNKAMDAFNKEDYQTSRDLWKQILEKAPDDKQAKEMLETTEMLLNALK